MGHGLKAKAAALLRDAGLYQIVRQLYGACGRTALELMTFFRHASGCRKARAVIKHGGPVKLAFGVCADAGAGWTSVGDQPGAALGLDLRRRLPFPDCSVDAIHAEHIMERLDYPFELSDFLGGCFRVLKVGGEFSASVLDFEKVASLYVSGDLKKFYSEKSWESPNWCRNPLDEINWLMRPDGSLRSMLDERNVVNRVQQAGFGKVRRKHFESASGSEYLRPFTLYLTAVKESEEHLFAAAMSKVVKNDVEGFDAFWSSEDTASLYASMERQLLWERISETVRDVEGPILDIGCGNGHLLEIIARNNGLRQELIYGVDYSVEAVRHAQLRLPEANLRRADVHSLEYPDGYFKAVIACETLEHVDDPVSVIREGFRVLGPGGIFVITIPNGELDDWEGHAHFWSMEEFRALLDGYCILTSDLIGAYKGLFFVVQANDRNGHAQA